MTTKAPVKKTGTPTEHVKHAIDELELARDDVSDRARGHIDEVLGWLRDTAGDLGTKARDTAGEWQSTLETAGDDLRVECGRRAVRAQQNTLALDELAAEITLRRDEIGD